MKRPLPKSSISRRRPVRAAEPELPRREAILDAALAVIAAGGAEQVTHRSVAARAGVPLGSTTYYFASRDELVREAFRRYAAWSFEMLSTILREVAPHDAAGLTEYLVEVARREQSGRSTLLVEYELLVRAARDPVLAADFQRYDRTLISGLAEALEKLGAAQPFDTARTLVALVRGFELDSLTNPEADLDDLGRRLRPIVDAALQPSTPRRKEKP